jgi:ketosteroid isomerase-like protein
MSRKNLQAVRALIDAWNSGDRDFKRLGAYFAPSVSLESPLSSVSGEPYRGHSGLERWARDLDEQFERWEIVPDEVRAVGDQVLAVATVNAVGRASAAALQFPAATVFTFASDHRLTRIHIHLQVREAFEAVGLTVEDRPGGGA